MSNLVVFAGIPGSGRKEKAINFAKGNSYSYISSDQVREELSQNKNIKNNLIFEECHRRIKRALTKGEDVVFDATNLYAKQRKSLLTQMRDGHFICYFVMDSLENCIKRDSENPYGIGEGLVIQKFMTAEIPFEDEGWNEVIYDVSPILNDEYSTIIQNNKENMVKNAPMEVDFANLFMEAGKPILDTRVEDKYKHIGYNNMSAQIAFRYLYSTHFNTSFIQKIVQLILYKKRIQQISEKGLETIKEQIGEELFQQLLLLK